MVIPGYFPADAAAVAAAAVVAAVVAAAANDVARTEAFR